MKLLLITCACAALAGIGYFVFSADASSEHVRALEREVSMLRSQLAEYSKHSVQVGQPIPNPPSAAPGTPQLGASDLSAQLKQVSELVERFEQTARDLNSRISGSKLNIPTRQELGVQIEKARTELHKIRENSRQRRAAARQIAISLNVPFDEKRLLDPGMSPVLDGNPAFVAARTAAIEEQRMEQRFEQRLAELRFSTVIEAVPAALSR
jgi:hypothetical protein